MRKLTNWLVGGLLLVAVAACKSDDEKEGSLTIRFKALYDGQPLQTFQAVPFVGGQRVDFSTLTALISDLKLDHSSGEEFLDEVELVDMSFDVLQDAEEGYVMQFTGLPARAYDGIQFWVGLPPELNHKKPADFPSSHPLSNTGYYWVAWDSYIFSKTEGRVDTLGTGPLNLNFAYHTGSDDLLLGLQGPIPIVIEEGGHEELNIFIDYKDLLAGIDIKSNPQNHNPQDSVQIGRIVTNLQTAVTLSH